MTTKLRLTDTANAERLISMQGHNLRYCPAMREWFVWDGRRWLEDKGKQILEYAKQVARSYENDADAYADDNATHKALVKHSHASENLRSLLAMVQLAQSHPDVIVAHEDFNRNPDLLNVANGTIDLTDTSFHKFDPANHITHLAPVVYAKGIRSEAWEGFLEDVLPDPDTRDFVQRAVGYSLTGWTFEEKLFLLYGNGQNGKTTFMSTLTNMLGDYAAQAAPSALMKTQGHGANNELYVLIGRRLILASETGESGKLNETLVKQMTGMDRVSVNPKYKSQMEFTPSWKIWLGTNYEPKIEGDDKAIWRRMIKVPFTAVITKPDPKLKLFLLNNFNERSGILNWCLEGVRKWQDRRLVLPDEVEGATNQYRVDQSIIGHFLRETCKRRRNAIVSKDELFNAYSAYCKRVHEKPKTKNAFGRQLHDNGICDTRLNNGRYWAGICVNRSVSLNPADWEKC